MPDEHIRLVHASGECEIDLARRELRVLGAPVPVGGRAFEIIEVLAQSAGELVTKNELMNRVWPGAIVMENTLHVHTTAVRKALGPYRSLLKTVSGRGYRLLGDWTVRRHDAAKPPVGLQRMRVDGESPVTNFPAPVTRLIGRTAAVAQLRDLVSAYRVVTLTGPGGIGKTSLALKVARGIVGEFADGGWLVELASLSDPALVPTVTADALRVPDRIQQQSRPKPSRMRSATKSCSWSSTIASTSSRQSRRWPKPFWRSARTLRSSRRAAKPSGSKASMSIVFHRWTFPLLGRMKRTTF